MLKALFGGGRRRPAGEKRKPVGRLTAMGWRAGSGPAPAPGPEGWPAVDGPHYLDVLGALHGLFAPRWYLEVGAFKGQSLARAACDVVAVDPKFRFEGWPVPAARRAHFFQMTSDDFFATGFLQAAGIRPDLAFLDGLHHYEALLTDFAATEPLMAPGGRILLHDCVPTSHAMADREWDESATRAWTGDVWKTLAALIEARPDLRVTVLDAWPTGLAIIENLAPGDGGLAARLPGLRARWDAVTLRDHGVARYFAQFEIQSSWRFLQARQAAAPSPDGG
jgi:hypothetical protein